jgi:hypothetical protein
VRILFDENVPLPLRKFFPSDQVSTVQEQGWAGIANGELVRLADETFDVLILADKNLRYQQNLADRRIAFVELPTNRWPLLMSIVQRVVDAVEHAKAGSYTVVSL